MDNLTNFDKLIINLSSNEKKELIKRMENRFKLSQETLHVEEEVIETGFKSFQEEYESLSVLQKFLLFLQSLVKQKDIPTILKEHKVLVLRRKYFSDCNLADFKSSCLNENFLNKLIQLKEPCLFFKEPLQKAFSNDNKQDFYAFIGGVVLPDLQEELLLKTDPWSRAKKVSTVDEKLIKIEIDSFLEIRLESISNLDRSIMNDACQSLFGLYLLCSFNIYGIIHEFDEVVSESGKVCGIYNIKDQLLNLAGILHSLDKPPSVRALEAVFLYSLTDNELKDDLNGKMEIAGNCLSTIREFNKNVSLENLVKVLSGDLNQSKKQLPVVDDWFRNFSKFWKNRTLRHYLFFANERKKQEVEKSICEYMEKDRILLIDGYSCDYYWVGSPARFEKSIAFIYLFSSDVFEKRIKQTLFLINIEGEFYKKDNKNELEKVLNYFSSICNKMDNVFQAFSGSNSTMEILSDMEDQGDEKKKKFLTELEQLELDLVNIINDFLVYIRLLHNLIRGIIAGDGGAYDTLSNISSIGGSSNPELRETFKVISLIINKSYNYISEMKILEEKEIPK